MMKRIFAILLALAVLSLSAAAEDGILTDEGMTVETEPADEGIGEAPETVLGLEAPEEYEGEIEATYLFMNGEEIVDTQTVRDGEAVEGPAAPEAPRGKVFSGWYVGDRLLCAEGETVVVSVQPDIPYVFVEAVFVDAAEPTEGQEEAEPADEAEPEEEQLEVEQIEEEQQEKEAPEEGQPEEEQPEEGQPEEEQPAEEQTEDEAEPVDETKSALQPADGLTYTGAPQELVAAAEGWLFSLNGEDYSPAAPTGTDAGEYVVYYQSPNGEAGQLTATIAKADVVFTPPVAATGEE